MRKLLIARELTGKLLCAAEVGLNGRGCVRLERVLRRDAPFEEYPRRIFAGLGYPPPRGVSRQIARKLLNALVLLKTRVQKSAEKGVRGLMGSPLPFFGSADYKGVAEVDCGSADCTGVRGGRLRVISVKTRRVSGSADSTGLMAVRSELESRVHGEG